MKAITVYTEEIDDMEAAAEELIVKTKDLVLGQNSLAILYIDEDVEYGELYEELRKHWNFPIVGCTALAIFTGDGGFHRGGIEATILTSDTCCFAAGITKELSVDTYMDEVSSTYGAIKAMLPGEEKLVLTYGGKVEGMVGDDIITAIGHAGSHAPLYGCLASDSLSFSNFKVFCNEEAKVYAQVFVLISGNLSPRFVSVKSISNRANFSYEVTEARGNQVFGLGSSSFIEALSKAGMKSDKQNVIADYVLTPFILRKNLGNGDMIEVSRNLTLLNKDSGSGSFLGGITQGASLEIGYINREDVQNSVSKAFEEMFEEIRENQNGEHVLLCNSCAARFLALGNHVADEASTYAGKLPEGVTLAGLYSYGEYCPVLGDSGREHNVFHNSTFTIMLL